MEQLNAEIRAALNKIKEGAEELERITAQKDVNHKTSDFSGFFLMDMVTSIQKDLKEVGM